MIHKPVMLNEVLSLLQPTPSKTFLDCTFGRGGHTKALLEYGATVFGVDRDLDAYAYGKQFEFSRFIMIRGRFSDLPEIFPQNTKFDGVLFDFGLSSNQIEDSSRGISFKTNGPLDMRMGLNTTSAYEFVNSASERELADVIYKYGEERRSRQIAKEIIIARRSKKLTSTYDLVKVISKAVPPSKIDASTRTFQAIRIYINDELREIEAGLKAVEGCTTVAISFHSLEDRIVKQYFRSLGSKVKPITPTKSEVFQNRRSRSAKLRYIL